MCDDDRLLPLNIRVKPNKWIRQIDLELAANVLEAWKSIYFNVEESVAIH